MRANEIFTSPLEKHKVRLSRESTLSVYISFLIVKFICDLNAKGQFNQF